MNSKISVKVCGITREADIEQVLSLGADYLGFILYSNSPRALDFEKAEKILPFVPVGKRVVVDVRTDPIDLERYKRAGFDYFQIHVEPSSDRQILNEYLDIIDRSQLWLAPRLAPADQFPEWIIEYAKTIVFDTYSKNKVGGTGCTGDFARFAELKGQFPNVTWVLAGGLNATNIADAVSQSTASAVDVNSGVESAPGVKNAEKLRNFFQALSKIES